MKNQRVSTGIEGLDEIMKGGFVPASSYLIVGPAGSGKTILSLQFFNECARRKEACLYFTFAEPVEAIRKNTAAFGWDLTDIVFVDFTKLDHDDYLNGEYSVFPPGDVERAPAWQRIYKALEEHKPERVVIDSATFLRYLSIDDYQYRKQIQKLINHLAAIKCLSLLLFEPTELAQSTSIALAVDCVLSISNEITRQKVSEFRTLEINKMRGSSFLAGRHPLRISSNGITVWPHRVEQMKSIAFSRKILSSGVEALDTMLCGGVSSGTCTILSGPSGVGKSSLGAQFLATAAAGGLKGAYYTFEEGSASILQRANSIKIPLEKLIQKGTVLLREINPLELYPDEFLEILRTDIEKNGVEVVMLDNLRGYNLAMEEFGNLVANMQNIVNYIRRRPATLFLVNEVEKLTGDVQVTDSGVSYLSDNVLLLRYAEYNGEIIKLISCLKKRLSNFDPALRELKITGNGILVGDKLDYLRGLLTGVPTNSEPAKPSL